jgi:hypothetical protein
MASKHYLTLDGVKVTAELNLVNQILTLLKNGITGTVVHRIWYIRFPNGEVREMHDSIFNDNFKEVK